MNWAYLGKTMVDLELERNDLIRQGHTLLSIKKILNEKYRSLSRKRGFTCPCCNNVVEMVLDTSFYFRHERDDLSRCPSLANMETYQRKTQAEDNLVHRVGKQIIRTILEGQARIHGAIVKEGYYYNKRLSIVPDFVIEFPQSQRVWAIDYITGLKSDDNYTNQIVRRKEIYQTYEIEPFFFLDIKWLTVNPHSDLFALIVPAEHQLSTVSSQDRNWSKWLQDKESEIGEWYMSETRKVSAFHPFPVHHILYLDPHHRQAHVLRYLYTGEQWNPTVTAPFVLPLEWALSLDHQQFTFKDVLATQEEDKDRFVAKLFAIHQPISEEFERIKAEVNRREEEERNRLRQINEENERIKQESLEELLREKRRRDIAGPEQFRESPFLKSDMRFTNKYQMQHVQRILSFYEEIQIPPNEYLVQAKGLVERFQTNGYLDLQSRNTLVNAIQLLTGEVVPYLNAAAIALPNFLTQPIKLDMDRTITNSYSHPVPIKRDTTELAKLDKKRKEKLKKMFQAKITGDSYLSSPLIEWEGLQVSLWRMIVFKSFEKYTLGQMNISGILKDLQANGVVFTQQHSLIQHPVQQLLDRIKKITQG